MDAKKITNLINEVWKGVEDSNAGKITSEVKGEKVIHPLGFQTFLSIVNSLMPKNVSGDMTIQEPSEPWKAEGAS